MSTKANKKGENPPWRDGMYRFAGGWIIKDVRGARQSLPAGFERRDTAPTSHPSLIMLAELLRDLSCPENRADSDKVGSEIKPNLKSEGDFTTRDSFAHSRFFQKLVTAGRQGQILPIESIRGGLWRMGGQNGGMQASRSDPTRERPGQGYDRSTRSHGVPSSRSLRQTQTAQT